MVPSIGRQDSLTLFCDLNNLDSKASLKHIFLIVSNAGMAPGPLRSLMIGTCQTARVVIGHEWCKKRE